MSVFRSSFTGINSPRKLPLLILIIIPFSISFVNLITEIYAANDPYLILAILYGLYPLRYSGSQYFKKIGYERWIVEYEFTRKITYLLIPILILVLVFDLTILKSEDPNAPGDLILVIWMFALLGNLLRMITAFIIKESEFYLAKAYIELASKEVNGTRRANYFIKGIKFYDRYLRRRLNLMINDINEIFNKVIVHPNSDNKEAINSLSLAFENENDN